MMNIKELAEKRFSVRQYSPEPVSQDDLDYVLETVRLAPSACNRQPWLFRVASSEAARARVQACYNREWFKSAPLYVVAMKDTTTQWVRPEDGKPHGDIDVAIATEHLCLAAAERGLGTCWVCNFDPKAAEALTPSSKYEVVALIPMGHPSPDCPEAPKKRKSLNEITEKF